jgi:release factor glutamine methyltransferase
VLYEPALALFSDEDGLKPLRLILSNAAVFLQPDGHILCEIGWKQGKNALKAASVYCARQARIIRDYGGRDRVLAVCIC